MQDFECLRGQLCPQPRQGENGHARWTFAYEQLPSAAMFELHVLLTQAQLAKDPSGQTRLMSYRTAEANSPRKDGHPTPLLVKK